MLRMAPIVNEYGLKILSPEKKRKQEFYIKVTVTGGHVFWSDMLTFELVCDAHS
jgi:hypothetical protein